MVWFECLATSITVAGLAIAGTAWLLGQRFIREFTRPGVTVEQGTPQWGGWTFPTSVTDPPEHLQRAVVFQAADGATLRGEFWAQTRRAPTIILSHGFHLPSRFFRSVAALEYAHGANILLFDYRGHGESSSLPTTCGNAEVSDLLAAVDVALKQEETIYGKIYIHGFSMGAAIALLLPPHAAIAGIIADSSYARLDEMIHLLIVQILTEETACWPRLVRMLRPLFPMLTHMMVLGGRLLFQARYRRPLIARPDRAIGGRSGRTSGSALPPILLIHAENDPLISLHHASRLVTIARAAGRAIHAYYTPCAIHCGSYGHDPQQYMTLLRAFVQLETQVSASGSCVLNGQDIR